MERPTSVLEDRFLRRHRGVAINKAPISDGMQLKIRPSEGVFQSVSRKMVIVQPCTTETVIPDPLVHASRQHSRKCLNWIIRH